MQNLTSLQNRLDRMTIFRSTLSLPVIKEMCTALSCPSIKTVCDVFTAAAKEGVSTNLSEVFINAVLFDDNIWSRSLSTGADTPDIITEAAWFDLQTLGLLSALTADDFSLESEFPLPQWRTGTEKGFFSLSQKDQLQKLTSFYAANGTGIFAKHSAFIWDKGIRPVSNPDPIRFCDLKGYERERSIVSENTQRFITGFTANNMLLYGDKGTGKSATVHSLLNEFSNRKLRLIEMSKHSLKTLSDLIDLIKSQPLYFILFIDDLSFSDSDDSYSALKAVLEGSLEATPKNCLIYATSNRRHLIKEQHSARSGDDVHLTDTLQETQSLSDRFGVTVTFIKPSKTDYLNIVEKLAGDMGIETPKEILFSEAEKWAMKKGGRSPRSAVQFLRSIGSKKQ